MLPFSYFTMCTLVMVGTTMYHLGTGTEEIDGHFLKTEEEPIYMSVLNVYLIIFGEYNLDGYQFDQWLVFVMATVLLSLIMLNLLIAIMSDTFERVMAQVEESDGLELNDLILDAESIQFRNRNKGEHTYLHWVEYKTGGDFNWGGKTNAVKNAMSSTEQVMMQALNTQQGRIQSLQKSMATQSNINHMKTDELSKKMDSIQV